VTATLTLKGTEKDNYTLTQPTGLSADITAKELTVSGATADNKIYDGNTDAEISGASLVGIVGLDDVDLDALSGTFASEIVGTHSVTATLTLKGTDKDNYSLTQPTGLSADITTKELTVSGASADDKVYDGNTDAEISGASLVGIVGLDDVDLDALTGTFESEIVGTHTVTATLTLKGTDKDNYSLTQPTGLSADITAKELTVSGASADDKVYDGNTDATISGASLVGIVGTDDVEFDDLTGVFESYLVGTHSVTATLTLMGTDKDNYSLTQPTGLTAEIYPGVPDHFTITSPGTATAGAASGNFVIALFDAFNNPTTSDVNATFNLSTNSTSGSNTFNPASPLLMLADTYTSTFTYAENRLGTFAITAVGATGPTGLIGESRSANITIQILPWQKASIGVSSGNTDFFPEINAGTFKQTAQGLSAPKNDVMNFEYQQLCGNGTVIARLADVVNGGWAGVMMRESNAVGSKTVLFKTKLYNPMANVGVRSTTNGNISNTTQNLPNIHWMKIQRTNANTFVVYTSYNGTTWIRRFTATVAMNNCINAGIFTENAVSGRTTTAWIDHAEVVGYLKDSDDENVVINTEDAFEVMIYPNPATDKVMITIPENEEKVKVTLINASGLVVETSEFNTMDVEYYINHIKPGMYLLRFERNGMIVNKRLVVL
ncbi:MAG: YDG domain-containing protein, partial [Bacteroidales bacterium]